MRWWGRALMVVAVAVAAAAPAKDQPQSVRERVIAIVRAQLPKAIVTPTDEQGFTLKVPDRDEQQVSVARIADFCSLNSAAECDEQVTTFAGSVIEFATTDYTLTTERLRVILRGKPDTDGYLATIADPAQRPLARPMFAGVSAVLAADFKKGTRLVTAGDLKNLKLSEDAAFALGTDQVLRDMAPIPAFKAIDGKIVVIEGFDYGASIMLRPERWQALNVASGGRLYLAIPSDNEVIVGITDTDQDLIKLRELISQEYALAARGISPLVYRWAPGGWVTAK